MFDRIEKGKYWDFAFSLVEGCDRVSPGCRECWLLGMHRRLWPKGKPYVPQVPHFRIDRLEPKDKDDRTHPLLRKKPTVYAIWSDLFHECVKQSDLFDAWGVMAKCPQHFFLVLTKRPERIHEAAMPAEPNILLGTTCENQEQADNRIPHLLKYPGEKFLSIEPMLGPIQLRVSQPGCPIGDGPERMDGISWVICGCESGNPHRPMHLDWIRSLRDQCQEAGVPFFFKQAYEGGKLVHAPCLDGRQWLEVPK